MTPLSNAAQLERPVPDQAAAAARDKAESAPGTSKETARPTPAAHEAAYKAHTPALGRWQQARQAAVPKGSARKPESSGARGETEVHGTELDPFDGDRASALRSFSGCAGAGEDPGGKGQSGTPHGCGYVPGPANAPPDPAARMLFERSLASAQAAALRRQHEAGRPTRKSLPVQKHFAGHSASARAVFQRSLASLHAATLRKGHEARTGSVSPRTGEPPAADYPPIASVQAASLRKGNEARRAARPRTLRQAGEGQRTLKPGPRWSPTQP